MLILIQLNIDMLFHFTVTDSEHHRIRDAFKRCTYNSSGPNTNSSLGMDF